MSWSEVQTQVVDIKKTLNKEYDGIFLGCRQITTKIGLQTIWKFMNLSGEFEVYGFTNLNKILENTSKGSLVQFKYTGAPEQMTKYGVKPVHQVTLKKWAGDLPAEYKALKANRQEQAKPPVVPQQAAPAQAKFTPPRPDCMKPKQQEEVPPPTDADIPNFGTDDDCPF